MSPEYNEKKEWLQVTGKVLKGYGVASGQAEDSPYPEGSIIMQTPFFLERGLNIRLYFPATLNASISPYKFKMIDPEWTLRDVTWFEGCCETFSFSRCRIIHNTREIDSLIYYPHPETKPDHFHDDSVLEILAPFLGEMKEGEKVSILLKRGEIEIC